MKTSRSLALLFLASLFILEIGFAVNHWSLAAQESNGFTLEQVLSSPFPSDLVAAPTGERIAWVFDAQGKRNVWVAEGPDFKARQLTQYNEDTGQELTELAFTHDGKWLVYVRGGNPNSAGEIPNPTSDPSGAMQSIYAAAWDTGRVIRLADGESPVVSPTDNRVVFSKDDQIHIVEVAAGSEPHQLFAARGSNLTRLDGRLTGKTWPSTAREIRTASSGSTISRSRRSNTSRLRLTETARHDGRSMESGSRSSASRRVAISRALSFKICQTRGRFWSPMRGLAQRMRYGAAEIS